MTTSTTDRDTREQLDLAEIDRLRSTVEGLKAANANEPGADLHGEWARINERRVWGVVRTSVTTANQWRYCDRDLPQDARPAANQQ